MHGIRFTGSLKPVEDGAFFDHGDGDDLREVLLRRPSRMRRATSSSGHAAGRTHCRAGHAKGGRLGHARDVPADRAGSPRAPRLRDGQADRRLRCTAGQNYTNRCLDVRGQDEAAPKLLFVGESWVKHTTHIKGFDQFTSVEYEEGAAVFLGCLERGGFDDGVCAGARGVPKRFPATAAGAGRVRRHRAERHRVELVPAGGRDVPAVGDRREPAAAGLQISWRPAARLVMVGGYMSFTGIDARARYGMSPLAVRAAGGAAALRRPRRGAAGPGARSWRRQDHPAIGKTPGRLAGPARLQQDDRQAGQHGGRDGRRRPAAGRGQPRSGPCRPPSPRIWRRTGRPPAFLRWDGYPVLWTALLDWACRQKSA